MKMRLSQCLLSLAFASQVLALPAEDSNVALEWTRYLPKQGDKIEHVKVAAREPGHVHEIARRMQERPDYADIPRPPPPEDERAQQEFFNENREKLRAHIRDSTVLLLHSLDADGRSLRIHVTVLWGVSPAEFDSVANGSDADRRGQGALQFGDMQIVIDLLMPGKFKLGSNKGIWLKFKESNDVVQTLAGNEWMTNPLSKNERRVYINRLQNYLSTYISHWKVREVRDAFLGQNEEKHEELRAEWRFAYRNV